MGGQGSREVESEKLSYSSLNANSETSLRNVADSPRGRDRDVGAAALRVESAIDVLAGNTGARTPHAAVLSVAVHRDGHLVHSV